jgi:hypothetical protein
MSSSSVPSTTMLAEEFGPAPCMRRRKAESRQRAQASDLFEAPVRVIQTACAE